MRGNTFVREDKRSTDESLTNMRTLHRCRSVVGPRFEGDQGAWDREANVPTIANVARKAAVPVSAAARVLSGRAYSAEETRRLVREAALDRTIVFGTQLVERGSVGALRKARFAKAASSS